MSTPGAQAADFISVDRLQSLAATPESAAPELPRVFAAANLPDEDHRNWATEVLEKIEEPPTECLAMLIELLKHGSSTDAYWACRLIGRMHERADSAESALRELLTSAADMTVREEAAAALGKLSSLCDTTCIALASAAEKGSPRLARLSRAALNK